MYLTFGRAATGARAVRVTPPQESAIMQSSRLKRQGVPDSREEHEVAGRNRPSFLKKQKEEQRRARAMRKREERQARRQAAQLKHQEPQAPEGIPAPTEAGDAGESPR